MQKSVAILEPVPNRVEPSFLYYALQTDIWHRIEFAGGSAQKNLLLRDLRRIASIQSAYDELMESSQRRVRILEAMDKLYDIPREIRYIVIGRSLGPGG